MLNELFPFSGINSVLVNYYPDNSSRLPFHSDNEPEICKKSYIFTLSLGSNRYIAFRNAATKQTVATVKLRHGALMLFSRTSQEYFEHSILPQTEPTTSSYRISLTFRCVINKVF